MTILTLQVMMLFDDYIDMMMYDDYRYFTGHDAVW